MLPPFPVVLPSFPPFPAGDSVDGRSGGGSLRSVQTWAGAALPGADPSPDQPASNPFDQPEPAIPEEEADEGGMSHVRERSGRTGNLKERLRKREKPEKTATQTRKTPQIFRKSGNAQTADPVEKARRQGSLPRSELPSGVRSVQYHMVSLPGDIALVSTSADRLTSLFTAVVPSTA